MAHTSHPTWTWTWTWTWHASMAASQAARKEKEVVFEAAKDYLEKAKGRYIEGFDADHPKVAWAVEGIASLYQ
eukprot:659039-Prymnesium_polylepis.2